MHFSATMDSCQTDHYTMAKCIVKSKGICRHTVVINSEIYYINTRQHANLHQPSINVTKYQKRVHNLSVKVFNMLPPYIKTESDNPKKFKVVLQKCLYENSFYSLEEYFELQKS